MQSVTAEPAFFGKTYDEALGLLIAARDYVAQSERSAQGRLGAGDRLRLCCETMRMTARLTQVMAWLMAQRAVHAGEMSQDELVQKQEPLSEIRICMEPGEIDGLPYSLVGLLERSHRLYLRVARLDGRVRAVVSAGSPGAISS